jgi:hypothetical protein
VVTAALLSGFLLIDGNPGTALEVWPLRGSGESLGSAEESRPSSSGSVYGCAVPMAREGG